MCHINPEAAAHNIANLKKFTANLKNNVQPPGKATPMFLQHGNLQSCIFTPMSQLFRNYRNKMNLLRNYLWIPNN